MPRGSNLVDLARDWKIVMQSESDSTLFALALQIVSV